MGQTSLASAQRVLADVFGFPGFRGGQVDAVSSVLADRDTLVLLPTGAGKSLCYQVPGLVASREAGCTTLVISPLIALMQDQVEALRARGVVAAALHSQLTDFDRREVASAFARGELEFLYCSPERASLPSFKRLLERAPVALVAIDEAHCMSQWGHDFRPEYMRLAELREHTSAPIIALTATATPRVMEEIRARLDLADPTIVRGDFARPNLSFAVEHHRGDATRVARVIELLEELGLRGKRGRDGGRALIYCATRKKTESVAKSLKAAGIDAAYYHAGRTPLARERARRAFDARRRHVLVATNAFGMGIDYPDVRVIVHFQAPGSLEAYYQEAGRAGRDGEPARCLLMIGRADIATQQRLQSGAKKARSGALEAVEHYAAADECRQKMLCEHFTGPEGPARRCGQCDVCAGAVAPVAAAPVREVTRLPAADRKLISAAVGRLSRPVGKRNLAKALRGSRAKSLNRGGLLQLPEYGALAAYDEDSIVAAIDDLLSRGVLERRGQKYPTVWLKGRPVRQARSESAATSSPRKKARTQRRHHTPITKALDNYRRRQARALKWKPYMVFQKRAIVAIEEQRPDSLDALHRIPGLGPAKIERFGDDILTLVREHGAR